MSAVTPASEHDVFVARDAELALLHDYLEVSLDGPMNVLFVTGEAGQGKSALLQAFMKQAIKRHASLIIANGSCSDIIGTGDPYRPVRQWMTMLCGDLDSHWGLGTISSRWARRLWQTAPTTINLIQTYGPNLPGTLVPPHLIKKDTRASQPPTLSNSVISQPDLFGQLTAVLEALADNAPLLLVLDDMQWADTNTIALFFHLTRQLRQSPILLICAYRPSDVTTGMAGERHPLATVIQEVNRSYGHEMIVLDHADHHTFLDALVDSQPNQLDMQFRERLFRQTGGHPLFTVELLREMRKRGDLHLNQTVQWTAKEDIDWATLPSKVESAMSERIDRLPRELREILKLAAVEGETFTAELIAHVLELSPRQLVRSLSSQLDQEHQLVEVVGIDRIGRQRLSRYRFRHNMIYHYMRSRIDAVEAVYLHESVADALITLAGSDNTAAVAGQLAVHYEAAGLVDQALYYAMEAGREAERLAAGEDARAHYQQAINLFQQLPDRQQDIKLNAKLQAILGAE